MTAQDPNPAARPTLVSVNRDALNLLLGCFQEGAYEPDWEPNTRPGVLFHVINELWANLEGWSDEDASAVIAEQVTK